MLIKTNQSSCMIGDIYGRHIIISTTEGLKVRDAAGRIIHDSPTAPILKSHRYVGHLYWFDDLSIYEIYDVIDPPTDTWTPVPCLTSNNANVYGGLFKVHARDADASGYFGRVYLALRPKGSGWGFGVDSNVPALYNQVSTEASGVLSSLYGGIVLECPIGDDNSIDFYFDPSSTSASHRVIITQLGVFI